MKMEAVTIKHINDIHVGDTACYEKTVTEANVMMFAQISGDYAPQHVSKTFGDTTMFHSRIAHGMLVVGLVGPVLTQLCGEASMTHFQNIRFRSVVLLNDTVHVQGVVTAVDEERQLVTIQVECRRVGSKEEDRPFITGEFQQTLAL